MNSEYVPYLRVALASLVKCAEKHEYELIVPYRDLNERNREPLEHIICQFWQKTRGRLSSAVHGSAYQHD